MSDRDLDNKEKEKFLNNQTRKSEGAKSSASSFSDEKTTQQERDEILKKINQQVNSIDDDRVIINNRKPQKSTANDVVNTRNKNSSIDTSQIKNTRAGNKPAVQPKTPPVQNNKKVSEVDYNINNLSPEFQQQFNQFLNQANANFNFNNPNFPNFTPNAFGGFDPNFFNNMPPNDFNQMDNNNYFNPPNEEFNQGNNFAPTQEENIPSPEKKLRKVPKANANKASTVIEPRIKKPTPQPPPIPQNKQENNDFINQNNEPEIDIPQEIEDIGNFEIPEETVNIQAQEPEQPIPQVQPTPQPTPQQAPQPNANFNFQAQIPENQQADIKALIDVRLEENVNEILAAKNVNDLSANLTDTAEDLIGNKIKRNTKTWLLLLGLLLLITVVFVTCYDDWFGKKINEAEVAGLTITIVPSSGEKGSIDAEYIYYPGSEISFVNNVRIGAELYKIIEKEDGTKIQEENEAFAFRFRFYIQFIDSSTGQPEDKIYDSLIESIVFPKETESLIRYDEVTDFYYYYSLVYPGEAYVPFASSVILKSSIGNEFQGSDERKFKLILAYKKIVPSSMDEMLKPEEEGGMPDAPAAWQEAMVFEFENYKK